MKPFFSYDELHRAIKLFTFTLPAVLALDVNSNYILSAFQFFRNELESLEEHSLSTWKLPALVEFASVKIHNFMSAHLNPRNIVLSADDFLTELKSILTWNRETEWLRNHLNDWKTVYPASYEAQQFKNLKDLASKLPTQSGKPNRRASLLQAKINRLQARIDQGDQYNPTNPPKVKTQRPSKSQDATPSTSTASSTGPGVCASHLIGMITRKSSGCNKPSCPHTHMTPPATLNSQGKASLKSKFSYLESGKNQEFKLALFAAIDSIPA